MPACFAEVGCGDRARVDMYKLPSENKQKFSYKMLDFSKKVVYNLKAIEKITRRVGTNPTLKFWKGESTLANIEEKVENLVSKTINDLGYELYDVEYVKEGKDYFLRIYIDSKKGIDLNDCEKVSNMITELLDKEDYIKEQYFLEVSSPRNWKIT